VPHFRTRPTVGSKNRLSKTLADRSGSPISGRATRSTDGRPNSADQPHFHGLTVPYSFYNFAGMRDATPEEIAETLAHALRYQGRKRVFHADDAMARITADRLVHALEASGFVVSKRDPAAAPTTSGMPAVPGGSVVQATVALREHGLGAEHQNAQHSKDEAEGDKDPIGD